MLEKPTIMKYLSFALLVLLGLSSCTTPAPTEHTTPNVLLIITDDQGWGDLKVHGNDSIDTPNLDQLAVEGIRMDNFYVSPVCAPTRASLLTGRYHLRTGTSWVTHRKEVMRAEEETIAEVFQANGYATGCFGKWHNGSQFPNHPNGQGFEAFYGFAAGHWNNYFDTQLEHNGKMVSSKGYITDVLTDKAIEFIRKKQDQAFLCYVPYNAPHSPFQVPDRYFDKYKAMGLSDKNASVHGMVENIDDNIGRLLQTLQELDLAENTIVVYLSDNGPNGKRYNGGMRGIKGSVHEGGVKVPCFISWPGHLPKNKSISTISAHIDLLPTLVELTGINFQAKNQLDGVSLVPLFEDQTIPTRPIFNIHTEGENRPYPAAVRTDQYRMVVEWNQQPQLYDMVADPGQQEDIAAEKPAIRDSMVALLQDWFKAVTQLGIQAPPIEVGHPGHSVTELPAPEAQLKGQVAFQGDRGWANDYIINWMAIADQATWEVQVETAGNYTVDLHYTCKAPFVGSVFKVAGGEKAVAVKIDSAFDPPFLESPDRVARGEVFEKEWKAVGNTISLEKGLQSITVSLDSLTAPGDFELKALSLTKL